MSALIHMEDFSLCPSLPSARRSMRSPEPRWGHAEEGVCRVGLDGTNSSSCPNTRRSTAPAQKDAHFSPVFKHFAISPPGNPLPSAHLRESGEFSSTPAHATQPPLLYFCASFCSAFFLNTFPHSLPPICYFRREKKKRKKKVGLRSQKRRNTGVSGCIRENQPPGLFLTGMETITTLMESHNED